MVLGALVLLHGTWWLCTWDRRTVSSRQRWLMFPFYKVLDWVAWYAAKLMSKPILGREMQLKELAKDAGTHFNGTSTITHVPVINDWRQKYHMKPRFAVKLPSNIIIRATCVNLWLTYPTVIERSVTCLSTTSQFYCCFMGLVQRSLDSLSMHRNLVLSTTYNGKMSSTIGTIYTMDTPLKPVALFLDWQLASARFDEEEGSSILHRYTYWLWFSDIVIESSARIGLMHRGSSI